MQPATETKAFKRRALYALQDDGIITDQEFDAQKKALLASAM